MVVGCGGVQSASEDVTQFAQRAYAKEEIEREPYDTATSDHFEIPRQETRSGNRNQDSPPDPVPLGERPHPDRGLV